MTLIQAVLFTGAIPLLVGYLFGSVNFGVVVSRLLYHEDIRTKGSGNAGTTNILRTYGKKAAALTLAGDMLKGVAAVVLCRWAGALLTGGVEVNGVYAGYLAAIGAVCGHLWPVWFGFKGGKGVATSIGVFIVAYPVVGGAVLFVLIIMLFFIKYGFIGSLTCISAITVYSCIKSRDSVAVIVCSLAIWLIVVLRHWSNVKRLIRGEENTLRLVGKNESKDLEADKGEKADPHEGESE